MATEIVCRYLEYISRVEGEMAAHKAWRRVQAGYLLSATLPLTTTHEYARKKHIASRFPDVTATEVMRIFKAKAQVGQQLHCSSRAKIGRRTVSEWLEPNALRSEQWQQDFLGDLSNSKYWIRRGDSENSRFVHELLWGGRMFGSFTKDECAAVKRWINQLSMYEDADCIFGSAATSHIVPQFPLFRQPSPKKLDAKPSISSAGQFELSMLESGSGLVHPIPVKLLPLWLTHTCLLQGFASIPYRTTNEIDCAVIRILRAQAGFDVESCCVAGMDEVWRSSGLGIISMGLDMMQCTTNITSLEDVLARWPCDFAVEMIQLSMRPIRHRYLLIGMAAAFVRLHTWLCQSEILKSSHRAVLRGIAEREEEAMEIIWRHVEGDKHRHAESLKGYDMAQKEIAQCFREAAM